MAVAGIAKGRPDSIQWQPREASGDPVRIGTPNGIQWYVRSYREPNNNNNNTTTTNNNTNNTTTNNNNNNNNSNSNNNNNHYNNSAHRLKTAGSASGPSEFAMSRSCSKRLCAKHSSIARCVCPLLWYICEGGMYPQKKNQPRSHTASGCGMG
jgi:hypothetical protein